jgi:uncharacterized protein
MDEPLPPLTAAEVRVLGALVEKQITTPEYYPLSLNALTNACNQLTNRDPVVAYSDQIVLRAIDLLREKHLAIHFSGAESRVAKYKHTFTEALRLAPAETAVLCVLMLRGAQTVGELRTRSERLHPFENLTQVEEVLTALSARAGQPLVTKLPRQPGTKEPRYLHLLSGPPDPTAAPPEPAAAPTESAATAPADANDERLAKLEAECAELRRELGELKQQFADFRRQFE